LAAGTNNGTGAKPVPQRTESQLPLMLTTGPLPGRLCAAAASMLGVSVMDARAQRKPKVRRSRKAVSYL